MRSSSPLRLWLVALSGLLLSLAACKADDPTPAGGRVTLELEHLGPDGQRFNLGRMYTSAAGDRYLIQKLKYYVSNVRLMRPDGSSWAEPASYHLVTVASGQPASIILHGVPSGPYTALSLAMGVDSAANSRTDQIGDLNPTNEMVWDWSTGYMFLKLEGLHVLGTAPDPATDVALELMPGTAPAYRTISLALPAEARVASGQSPVIRLKADVNRLFGGPRVIRLPPHYFLVQGADTTALKLADNYGSWFSVD